jgi:hypothetical protein
VTPRRSSSVALLLSVTLAGCSLGVTKPPSTYRAGIVPDCESSVVPPALDYAATAGSLSTMVLDDSFFCIACPLPWVMAAAFFSAAVFGTRRVGACRAREAEHRDWLGLPAEQRQQAIDARRARDGR